MKVLLIDDHPLILSALQAVIEGLGDHVSVVGAESASEGRRALAEQSGFDLVLLDLQLGDADGFDVLAEFRQAFPRLPVVVVSASDRVDDVVRAIELGAMGFVPKRASNELLFDALRVVMAGGIYVPPVTLGAERPAAVAAKEGEAVLGAPIGTTGFRMAPSIATLGLTPRQTDVLALLLQGKANKVIAREMNLSVETVKDHVAAVLRTLGVSSRTQAVLVVGHLAQQSEAGQPAQPR